MPSKERIQELDILQKAMGYTFADLKLLNKALTHKSYTNEKNGALKHNERFEFLGDSVLDLVVSDFLIREYRDHSEGILSKIRAAVVNEACLAEMARKFDLGRFLLLGKGEDLSGGRKKNSLLANAFEALVGALYCDGGLASVAQALLPHMQEEIEKYGQSWKFRDYKSDLQEYTQNKLVCMPTYRVVREIGPDHDKRFEVTVTIRDKVEGKGLGRSKKEAEQEAAMEALEKFAQMEEEE